MANIVSSFHWASATINIFQVVQYKSCKCPSTICHLVEKKGLNLNVVSGGEIYTALQVGFPAKRIIFHGNNKYAQEIDLAMEAGVGRLVVARECYADLIQRDIVPSHMPKHEQGPPSE